MPIASDRTSCLSVYILWMNSQLKTGVTKNSVPRLTRRHVECDSLEIRDLVSRHNEISRFFESRSPCTLTRRCQGRFLNGGDFKDLLGKYGAQTGVYATLAQS
ncbi:uncharacterized protein LOC118648144 [Monomorium pharaonis]|uniref:uncharacterized protein LOC105832730 n=1 Tax=Monomorium pharaonis TaxID=307658 RepID=UPI00063F1151|nr:uncharacterized protein LOC105832730 [Monomorium pharaonis]XP_036150326.1 uncharacterized protein LOC118648144 [Monomorium pharaonis]